MRLLLVEDEPAIRAAVGRALRRWGHEVQAAGSVSEARELAVSHAPGAVLSDLKLPDGSGLDLALGLGLPFALMSGFAAFDEAVVAMRNGCVDFLTKPVSMQDLQTAVQRLGGQRCGATADEVVVGDGRIAMASLGGSGFAVRSLDAATVAWADATQAQEGFARLGSVSHWPLTVRQVASELLLATPAGRLAINVGEDGSWRIWLDAPVPWEDPAHADRRRLIASLCHRCSWRGEGCLVEGGREAAP